MSWISAIDVAGVNVLPTPSWKKFWFFGMSLACPYAREVAWTLYDQKLKSVKS